MCDAGFIFSDAVALVKKNEGFSKTIYEDTAGNLTVGHGIKLAVGVEISIVELDFMFQIAFVKALEGVAVIMNDNDFHFVGHRRGVLIDMAYNLGKRGLEGFKKMLQALHEEDYEKAADEMVDSKWYKQVGNRGILLVQMMRTDVWEVKG